MAKKPINNDPHNSFEDSGLPIGQVDFPLSELAERTAQRDRDEAAQEYAVEQSEQGFPEDEEALGDE